MDRVYLRHKLYGIMAEIPCTRYHNACGVKHRQVVFSALNKVEWFFSVVIVAIIFLNNSAITFANKIWFALILAILIIQTAWLLPALNYRAKAIIGGKNLPRSNLHWYFVIAEFLKLVALILFGFTLLKLIIQLK
ncbi:MAG TPA: hypothetical protein VGP55_02440 [Chitinophagaceae bacterium]|nr:hypothetical protein [Chitinophagaceae bacterium]